MGMLVFFTKYNIEKTKKGECINSIYLCNYCIIQEIMKKTLLLILSMSLIATLYACSSGKAETVATEVKVAETQAETQVETQAETETKASQSINMMTEREFSFDPDIDFEYTGDDKYLKVITADMIKIAKENYEIGKLAWIPVPYIVKVDDSNKEDIKVYGDFFTEGYEMSGTIFHFKAGGSYPGAYHLKDEDGEIKILSREIAEDGSNYMPTLIKICGNDEALANEVTGIRSEKGDVVRIEYVKMYGKANNLRISGIKDYGWPIILFDDIDNAEFIYNFYRSYFDEIREEDILKDLPDRIKSLREKYFTKDLLKKIDDTTKEVGADMVINAQDVTDEMLDSLQVSNDGNNAVKVAYDNGDNNLVANVKLEMVNGKKMISDISFE